MLDLNLVKADTQLEEEGVWVPLPVDKNVKFKLARLPNKRYKALQQMLAKSNPRAKNDEKKLEEIDNRLIAETIVVGWEGVKNGDVEFAYNRENAIKLLEHYPDVKTWIINEAASLSNFI